jgi:hypothetical protein
MAVPMACTLKSVTVRVSNAVAGSAINHSITVTNEALNIAVWNSRIPVACQLCRGLIISIRLLSRKDAGAEPIKAFGWN